MIKPAMSTEDHYLEVVETATGKVVETLGPMSENKADRVDQGIQINMNHERYHTRTGTRAALDAEAAAHAAGAEPASPTAQVAADLGLKAAPGWEGELEDGQGLAVLAAASAPIGPARAARLQEDVGPAARAEEKRRRHERMIEDKAAELLAAGLEFAADPKSRARFQRLRGAALGYGDARGIRPQRRKTATATPTKKGRRR